MKGFRHYGYTGKVMEMKWNDSPEEWVWSDIWIPVRIIAEYPKFLVAEVLPHRNPNSCWGESKPYKIGINKMNLIHREIELR